MTVNVKLLYTQLITTCLLRFCRTASITISQSAQWQECRLDCVGGKKRLRASFGVINSITNIRSLLTALLSALFAAIMRLYQRVTELLTGRLRIAVYLNERQSLV